MMARSTNRSNQRPDTLMQDRKANRSMKKPLATHGRTIHSGQSRQIERVADTSARPSIAPIRRQDGIDEKGQRLTFVKKLE